MALFKFTKTILAGEKIHVFDYGGHRRDFTYIDDIAEGLICVLDQLGQPNPSWSGTEPGSGASMAPWLVYNIGNNNHHSIDGLHCWPRKNLGETCGN